MTSGLDPSFGQGGVVLGPVALDPPATYTQSSSRAVVQPDGKIVVVGGYVSFANLTATLTVERFNADGSVDPTFGNAGSVNVPVPVGLNQFGANPGAAIAPDGKIVLAAGLSKSDPTTGTDVASEESIVVRLTSSGQLDPSFANGGEFVVKLPGAEFDDVAVQPDGKIVAAGQTGTLSSSNPGVGLSQITLIRLTTAGALDATFNGTGTLDIVPKALNTFEFDAVGGFAIEPGGQILVASSLSDPINPLGPNPYSSLLTRIDGDGTPDSTFGAGGTVIASNLVSNVKGLVVQPDGKVVLSGTIAPTSSTPSAGLVRLLPGGSADPSFQSLVPSPANGVDNTQVTTVALGPDGEFTVGGRSYQNGPSKGNGLYGAGKFVFVVERYLSTGAPDPAFGMNGKFTFYVDPSAVAGQPSIASVANPESVSVTPSGKILIAGRLAIDATDSNGYLGVEVGTQSVLAQLLTGSPTPSPLLPPISLPPISVGSGGGPITITPPPPVGPLAAPLPIHRSPSAAASLGHSKLSTQLRRSPSDAAAKPTSAHRTHLAAISKVATATAQNPRHTLVARQR